MNARRLTLTFGAAALALTASLPAQQPVPDSTRATTVDASKLPSPLDPLPSRAQVLVGPRFGITRNFHSGGFRTINDPNCPVFEEGSGIGYLAGITAEAGVAGAWGIVGAVVYESRPGSFTQRLPDARVATATSGETALQSVSMASTVEYRLLTAELLYKQDLPPFAGLRFALMAGPTASYLLDGRITQLERLEAPLNARLINPDPERLELRASGRELVFAYGDAIPGARSTRLALKGGLTAELPMFGRSWTLYPGIFVDYGLTDVTTAENWSLNTLSLQVDLRRAF